MRKRRSIVMLLRAADENFSNDIIRGLLRRRQELSIVRVQDAGLSGADDAAVQEWAAQEGRLLLTRDVTTMTHHAYERVHAGKPMPPIPCWQYRQSKANSTNLLLAERPL